MDYKIRISTEAENDIKEAFLWYEYNQAGLGDDFIRNIEESFKSISKNPSAFLKITEKSEDVLFINIHMESII
jgi:toxin ParE1/3/4